MRYSAAAVIAIVFLALYASAQGVPKLPEKIADVVNIPLLKQQPTKIIDPVYPQIARQGWIQGEVVLDVLIGKTGAVENVGCGEYCCMSPDSLIESAAAAVRQWRWAPIWVNGKPTRVRTKVAVNFVLDETSPPIDLCTVLGNSAHFDRRTINVSGTVQRVEQLALFRSSHCSGSVVVADKADGLRPLKNEKYAAYEAAIASTPTAVSLRGEFQEDKSPGALGGKRLLLERVLQVDASTAPSR